MNEVLGTTAGNALEVREAVRLPDRRGARAAPARGHGRARRRRARAVPAVRGRGSARAKVEEVLASGAAAERFGAMVTALGGPADFVENPALPEASVHAPGRPRAPRLRHERGHAGRRARRHRPRRQPPPRGRPDRLRRGAVADRPDRRAGRAGPPAGDRPRARRRAAPPRPPRRCCRRCTISAEPPAARPVLLGRV